MKKEQITIKDIMDFNFAEKLELKSLPKEEQDDFNAQVFGNLMGRIISKTKEKLSLEEQKQLKVLIEAKKEFKEILGFIQDRNDKFLEESGEEFLNFKEEVYELLKSVKQN